MVSKKQPLQLELGCGKGGFMAQLALQNPNVNYLAVDIKSEVLAVGRRNIVKLFEENGRPVDNIALMSQDIERIDQMLSPDDQIERIYINFCNPWPKAKHKKRRLTFPKQLNLYKTFLAKGGEIRFKTDDKALFTTASATLARRGFLLYSVQTTCITARFRTILKPSTKKCLRKWASPFITA